MKWLIRVFPRRWRERYGEEVQALLEENPPSRADVLDVARGALDAHRRAGSIARFALPTALLLLVEVTIGWLNYHASDDVQPVAGALILGGFAYTLWRPRWAWAWVLLLWLAVPLSSLVAYAANHHPGLLKPAPLYETVVALIPVAFGAAVGGGLRALLSGGHPDS